MKEEISLMCSKGSTVKMVTGENNRLGDNSTLTTGTPHADLCVRKIRVGQKLLIADGVVVLRVSKRLSSDEIQCEVEGMWLWVVVASFFSYLLCSFSGRRSG